MSIRIRPLALLLPLAVAAASWASQPDALFQDPQDPVAPKTLDPEESCTARCHQDRTAHEFLHGPVAEDGCVECHMQDDEELHEFMEFDDIQNLCGLCHEMEFETHLHAPVEDDECIVCHDPHGSANKSMLVTKDQATLCGICHDTVLSNMEKDFVHGPVAGGQCTLCHDAHSAAEEKLLEAESIEVCLSCHEHQANALDEAEEVHAPVMASCTPCHDAHGGDHRYMIRDETREMCLGCHSELRDAMSEAAVQHGAIDLEESCLSCHRAHDSRFPSLLSTTVEENCRECHQDEIERSDGPPVAAIGKLLDGAEFRHGPIREGDCTGCHGAHASEHTDLLTHEYPRLFYAPYQSDRYEICFNCHDRKVFEAAKTDSLTGFRDGNNNLHYIHVSREKKGRTCRACHEVHGSNMPHHMAKDVPFGNWRLPIEYTELPSGGSCAPGCHKPFAYDRGDPILEGEEGSSGADTAGR